MRTGGWHDLLIMNLYYTLCTTKTALSGTFAEQTDKNE
jgi:hypothetical protein